MTEERAIYDVGEEAGFGEPRMVTMYEDQTLCPQHGLDCRCGWCSACEGEGSFWPEGPGPVVSCLACMGTGKVR